MKCKNPECRKQFVAKCCGHRFCCRKCGRDYNNKRRKELKIIEPSIRQYWVNKVTSVSDGTIFPVEILLLLLLPISIIYIIYILIKYPLVLIL